MPLNDFAFIPPVIAHRGASQDAPENTILAFEEAFRQGATWFETDVKLSRDGIPILFHDDTLDRTTSGHGPVADASWDEIQSLDAGGFLNPKFSGARVPHLKEFLHFAIAKYVRISLEIKPCAGRAQATTMVTLIEAAKIWPDDHPPPLISSFNIEALEIAARLQPDWPRGLLIHSWQDDWADYVERTQASSIHLLESLLTAERVLALVESELPILAYTVNDPRRARELINWGLSAVYCDNPAEVIRHLDKAS